VALFAQSLVEVIAGRGVGYLDSMTGLIFFLLIGRVFQDKTYRRLSFDRDYTSFFPLAVKRRTAEGDRTVPLSDLAVGDRIVLRRGELIPADARVLNGVAVVDYSFVTGEAEPVERGAGETVQAGGQQVGGVLELEILRPVSQSYLTSLWSHEAFRKDRDLRLKRLLNRFSRGFTLAVIALALGAAAWWWPVDAGRAVRAFTAVLIVACPCALALSAPFALGTAQRLMARRNVFVKNTDVIERMAAADTVAFDKTGTLTSAISGAVVFEGAALSDEERRQVRSVAASSTHPHSVRIVASLTDESEDPQVRDMVEERGMGVAGVVEGADVRLGSAEWLGRAGVAMPAGFKESASAAHLLINGFYRGTFRLENQLRPEVERMVRDLAVNHQLALLSGDNDRDSDRFRRLLGAGATVVFQQAPVDKLEAIATMQSGGRTVVMVGDGLNDAGALRQSDVGVAVVENIGTFSPASDVIMEARRVSALAVLMGFARDAVRVVWAGIALSLAYNLVGLGFAASGRLSPILCAILMPLSSITVVALACGAVNWSARRAGLLKWTIETKGIE
jgi:Cu+-exporting ATPase